MSSGGGTEGIEENTDSTELPPSCTKLTGNHKCCLCYCNVNDPLKLGDLYKTGDVTAHYFCLLFSSSLVQNGEDNEGILGFFPKDIRKEIRRGSRLKCCHCKRAGATIGCIVKECRKSFHLPCGLENNSLHQFFDQFRSYCSSHRPVQKVSGKFQRSTDEDDDSNTCPICYDPVTNKVSYNTLWAPCCKKRWFHRLCVQRQALAQGYFFKCPMCNNKDEFSREMKKFGIYIPEMDAAWEREPDAFQDLLQTYRNCDARTCKCPSGRSYFQNTGSWRLLRCNACGSQGTHIMCSSLKMVAASNSWRCSVCSKVISKASASWVNETRTNQRLEQRPGASTHGSSSASAPPGGGLSAEISQRRQADFDQETQPNKRSRPSGDFDSASSDSNQSASSSGGDLRLDSNTSLSKQHSVSLPGTSRSSSDEDEIIVVDDSGSDVEIVAEKKSPAKPNRTSDVLAEPSSGDRELFTREGNIIKVHKVTAEGDETPMENGNLGAVKTEPKNPETPNLQQSAPTLPHHHGGPAASFPQQIYVPVIVDGRAYMQPVAVPQVPLQQQQLLHGQLLQMTNRDQHPCRSIMRRSDTPDIVTLD